MNGSNSNTSGSTVVCFSYKNQASGDAISDRQMKELVRRLEGSINPANSVDIWSGADEPKDRTQIWWPIDPTSGVRIGQPRTYDTQSGKWIVLGAALPDFRQHRSGLLYLANSGGSAADATADASFAGWGGDAYDIAFTPIAKNDTAFITPPANMNNFGVVVIDQKDGKFTVTAFKVPAGGIGLAFAVTEIDANKV